MYLPNDLHPIYTSPQFPPQLYAQFVSFGGFSGSVFQISVAYSSMQRSLLKKPMRATLVIVLVSHYSWFLYASSMSFCVSMYDLKSSETR